MHDDMPKGRISREHTMWCGRCGNWEQVAVELKSEAIKVFCRSGWKKTKEHGWVCGDCGEEAKTR